VELFTRTWGPLAAPAMVLLHGVTVAGAERSHLPQAEIATMADLMSAEFVTIDAGHLVHETRPAEFAAAVERFLADTNR
jgi:pimeloyl-ACP methyl ester carboxylesterase